jgi:hypothetical protein
MPGGRIILFEDWHFGSQDTNMCKLFPQILLIICPERIRDLPDLLQIRLAHDPPRPLPTSLSHHS